MVPSASLIPHDPTVLFTVAGMVPFKAYFTGDETPPFRRATDVQKCVRAGGKHNDLDDVGRTRRHLVFFEMMGNWSFGDYFKELAIPWAWEYVTEDLGFDGDRMWITVHTSDDEAEQIWHDVVGVPMERIQRLGDKDNFWQMGDTGPCGPCSELHIDRGPAYGPDGGPLADPAGERFMEFWNLVFMQYDQAPDGTRTPLPRPSIDTGAGLERILALLQGVDSVWDTDVLRPIIEVASSLTGHAYGRDERTDVSLRILAEHARSGTMLVNDGVFPSNEDRGYVLRRILRRAVRHAYLLGADKLVMPGLVEESIDGDGRGLPRRGQEPRLHHRRDHPRGGAVPPDAADRPHHPGGRAVAPAREVAAGRGRVQAPRHLRLPAGGDDRDHRRAGRRGRRRRLQRRDGRAAPAGQGGPARRAARTTTARPLPRAGRAVRHHRVLRRQRRRGRRARPGRRAGASATARTATVEIFTRPHALLRRVRRPGR